MSDVPELNRLPRWLRFAGRVGRVLTYAVVVVLTIVDVRLDLPGSNHLPTALVLAVTITMSALALAGVVAVIGHRWRWEWVLAFWLSAVLCLRALLSWADPGPPPQLALGAAITGMALGHFLRGIDLTVFALKTSAWAIRLRKAAG